MDWKKGLLALLAAFAILVAIWFVWNLISMCGFCGIVVDAPITQSKTYWLAEARPFIIASDRTVFSNGTAVLSIGNADEFDLTVTQVDLGAIKYPANFTLKKGEWKELSILGLPKSFLGVWPEKYRLGLNITYSDQWGMLHKQIGKDLVGKYS